MSERTAEKVSDAADILTNFAIMDETRIEVCDATDAAIDEGVGRSVKREAFYRVQVEVLEATEEQIGTEVSAEVNAALKGGVEK